MLFVLLLGLGACGLFLYFEAYETSHDLLERARAPTGQIAAVEPRALAESLFAEMFEPFSVFLPFVLAALVLIWLISGWSLRPLARASREAATVGPKNLFTRLSTEGLPTEILALVEAMNSALDRLADAYEMERRLTANAAHQLRTPLAVLNLRLQRAKLEDTIDWPTVERELAGMNRLVNQLMDLARKENPAMEHNAADIPLVNLARIVREAAAMTLPLAETEGRQMEVEARDKVWVRGCADDLRDMVRNLLENALTHGRGTLRIDIRSAVNDHHQVIIEVSDEGAGIPDQLRETIFERFCKGNANSPGAGLGLAIVRQVAQNHGGQVRFLSGAGCRVQVLLPIMDE